MTLAAPSTLSGAVSVAANASLAVISDVTLASTASLSGLGSVAVSTTFSVLCSSCLSISNWHLSGSASEISLPAGDVIIPTLTWQGGQFSSSASGAITISSLTELTCTDNCVVAGSAFLSFNSAVVINGGNIEARDSSTIIIPSSSSLTVNTGTEMTCSVAVAASFILKGDVVFNAPLTCTGPVTLDGGRIIVAADVSPVSAGGWNLINNSSLTINDGGSIESSGPDALTWSDCAINMASTATLRTLSGSTFIVNTNPADLKVFEPSRRRAAGPGLVTEGPVQILAPLTLYAHWAPLNSVIISTTVRAAAGATFSGDVIVDATLDLEANSAINSELSGTGTLIIRSGAVFTATSAATIRPSDLALNGTVFLGADCRLEVSSVTSLSSSLGAVTGPGSLIFVANAHSQPAAALTVQQTTITGAGTSVNFTKFSSAVTHLTVSSGATFSCSDALALSSAFSASDAIISCSLIISGSAEFTGSVSLPTNTSLVLQGAASLSSSTWALEKDSTLRFESSSSVVIADVQTVTLSGAEGSSVSFGLWGVGRINHFDYLRTFLSHYN